MNTAQVIPFHFEYREVRTLLIDNTPWFVAADICGALDIVNHRDALSKLDNDEKGVGSTDTLGGKQKMAIVNESGLYTLILRCRDAVKPGTTQHKFRKWVTSEVLPAIRKHGRYEDNENKMAQLVNETIGQNGFKILQAAIKGKVSNIPAQLQHGAKCRIWNKVHSTFGVLAAKNIPSNQLDDAIQFVAAYGIEGEYIPKSSPLQNPQLNLNYPDRFPGQKWLSYREMYPGTWDVNLLGFICALEQYEGQTVPLKVTGTQALKREVMSLMGLVDDKARKLEEIKQLVN